MEHEKLVANISKNLKNLRKKHNLTQKELIEKIGEEYISLRTYKSYESKDNELLPDLDKMIVLAEFYKCSLDQIIFGKESIYNDSFTKGDSLKRLLLLIYSLVLIPQKESDPTNKYYGYYYFLAYDKEVSFFMDKYIADLISIDYRYKIYNENKYNKLLDFNEVLSNEKDLEKDWRPTIKRASLQLIENGIDPEKYLKEKLDDIEKFREIGKLKSEE